MSETAKGRGVSQWLGIVVVLGLLTLLLRHVEWDAVRASFSKVDLRFIPVLVFLVVLNFLIRSWRWRYLLVGGESMSFRSLVDATTAGFMASFLLPFRAGEVARPWVLTRWESIGFGSAAASIVVERVIDALVIIGVLSIAAEWIDNAPEWLEAGTRVLGLIALVGLVMMLMAYFFSRAFSKLGRRMIRVFLFPRFLAGLRNGLYQLMDGFLQGLKAISNGRQLWIVMIASLALWLEMAVFYQVCLWTLGLQLSPLAGVMVMVLVALAIAAPGPPGFLGTFQIGCLAALGLFGVSREMGLSYAVVAHVVQAACIIPAGLWILHARGLRLRDSIRSASSAQSDSGED